jgi:hypothetical protein
MQAYFDTLWARTRQARLGFVAGLIVGALVGWFFHGLISFIIRFFVVLVLIVPFVLALIAWWRLRREVDKVRGQRAADQDWPPLTRRPYRPRPEEAFDDRETITVDGWDHRETPERSHAPDRDIGRNP